jgi:hypothetical protein
MRDTSVKGFINPETWFEVHGIRRVLLHVVFWIAWLSRTYYDLVSLFGMQGSLIFLSVYASAQIPMVYFHLYVLAPQLLHKRRYVLYAISTVSLLFVYSYVNFTMLKSIPNSMLPNGLETYIDSLNSRYDIFEGLFALVVSYSLKYAWQAVSTSNKLLQLQKDATAER